MQVKICGITRLEDALAAFDAGADMLGYNFYAGSKRCLSEQDCTAIQSGLAARNIRMTTVGVFVNHLPAEIDRIMAACGLGYAQLSGDETPADLDALHSPAFKAIRPQNVTAARDLAQRFAAANGPPALLVDAPGAGAYGGTGRPANRQAAAFLADRLPILLAGGLDPGNVAAAVAAVRPWGVDVASGVESAPGIKDHGRIARFVQAARSIDNP